MKIQIAAKISALLILCAGLWYCFFEIVMRWYYNYDLKNIFHLDDRGQEIGVVSFVSDVFLGLALLVLLVSSNWLRMLHLAAKRLDDSRTYYKWHEVISLCIPPLIPLKLIRDACKGFTAVLQKHGINTTIQAKKSRRATLWWWISSTLLLTGSCISGRLIDYTPPTWDRMVIHYPLYVVITIIVLTVIFILLSLNMISQVTRLAKEALAFNQTDMAIVEHLVD